MTVGAKRHEGAYAPPPAEESSPCRVNLRCPKCGAQGLVHWNLLGRALDCPECACRFVVMRDGAAVALESLPQVAFVCPRCHARGSVAEPCAARGTACRSCNLPLAFGPDGRLYSEQEATRLRQEAKASSGGARKQWRKYSAWLRDSHGALSPLRILPVVIGATLVMLLTLGAVAEWLDRSPEKSAERLVRLCLANSPRQAESYVDDDPAQLIEFERWRLRRFSSLRDEFRPPGDWVEIRVATIDSADTMRTFRVTLTSPMIGERTLQLPWKLVDGAWRFDAIGALAVEQKPQRLETVPAGRRPLPGRRPVSPMLVPSGF